MRLGRLFRAHGEFCASHPWEVIIGLVSLTACVLSIDKNNNVAQPADDAERSCTSWRYGQRTVDGGLCEEPARNIIDIILMMVVRCTAILYIYYHFCHLQKLGSKYILGLAALFALFSSFIFTTTVLNILGCEISDLKDALFLFLLLIDLSRAGILAQLALCGANQSEVTTNIARGMEVFGPAMSLDTLVEALVIGVGTLSGVQRLELLSAFAVLSALVNYIVFMTFYPACLSLILELTHNGRNGVQQLKGERLIKHMLLQEDCKPNPVVQRVKVIMSSGLFVVHVMSRFPTSDKESDAAEQIIASRAHEHLAAMNKTDTSEFSEMIMHLLSFSLEQIFTYILIITLGAKFLLFDRYHLSDHLIHAVANEQEVAAAAALNESRQQNQAAATVSTPPVTFTLAETVMVEEKATQSELSLIGNGRFGRKVRKHTLVEQNAEGQQMVESASDDDEEQVLLDSEEEEVEREPRPVEECVQILQYDGHGKRLTDTEVEMIARGFRNICPLYKIEKIIGDAERGVRLRRYMLLKDAGCNPALLNDLPYLNYDYSKVMDACCENVIGYVPIPVGYAGPLLLDGTKYFVPMATTEGALVASTNRGCKAVSISGVTSYCEDIGMTRAPCVRFPNVLLAAQAKRWMESDVNFQRIKKAFDSTSRYARLQDLYIAMDGPVLYIRFRAFTGDAMGMNMLSKGTEKALREIQSIFPEMVIISLSGNYCSDKKSAAINWIKGRGKRVVCETIVPADKLALIFRTNARTLVQCNKLKNMTGSAVAGSIGGNNAHAANMVTAIFIATGQDPAQNVTSSNCSTNMETCGETGEDLYITCTMPSLEVGTLGGGTGLPGQGACLNLLGVRGSHPTNPAENSKQLARIICATVMAGELSLLSALVTSDLVNSHMRHNRSSVAINPNLHPPTPAVVTPAKEGEASTSS